MSYLPLEEAVTSLVWIKLGISTKWNANRIWTLFYNFISYDKNHHTNCWPSRLGLQNILTASLQRGKTPECPGYDTEQSDGEAPEMLELWGMWSTSLLSLLPGPLWPRVVTPDRVLSMGQIELNCILMLNWIVLK